MRLELDFPHNFPELFIHTFHDIYHKLTQGLHTELIPSMIFADLSGDFPLGDSRQPTYKSLRPFDLVS